MFLFEFVGSGIFVFLGSFPWGVMVSLGSFSVVSLLRLFRLFVVGHLERGVEAVGRGRAVGLRREM